MTEEEYLGDGLYVSFDGFQFCLRAPRGHVDHVVYLDPQVFKNFNDYARRRLAQPDAKADS
jgi:hypothetical protein